TTFAYLKGRPYAPKGEAWDKALAFWRTLPTDEGATFDREVHLDAAEIAPMVTWGTSPEAASPITGHIPDPAGAADRVFIGSCTNSRIEDLRVAASLASGRKTVVPSMVVPGSGLVKAQAEAEGL